MGTNGPCVCHEKLLRRLEAAEELLEVLERCPTRMRGGAGGQTLEATTAATYITHVPLLALEDAIMKVRYGELYDQED